MNKRTVFHLVATVTLVIGLSMGVCAALSMVWFDPVWAVNSLLTSSVMTVLFGAGLLFFTRGDINLSRRDGFGVVTLLPVLARDWSVDFGTASLAISFYMAPFIIVQIFSG